MSHEKKKIQVGTYKLIYFIGDQSIYFGWMEIYSETNKVHLLINFCKAKFLTKDTKLH